MESGGSQKLSDYLGFGWDVDLGVLCVLVLFRDGVIVRIIRIDKSRYQSLS